jgi:copper chaperone CopZ
VCAHAVRVALKSIPGVQAVDVSLEKGEAVATFSPGNTVRYEQLLRAIEKNGFVVKGSKLVADGRVNSNGGSTEFEVSGSNDRFRLEPANSGLAAVLEFVGNEVEITGAVPEVPKGKTPDVLRYESVVPK